MVGVAIKGSKERLGNLYPRKCLLSVNRFHRGPRLAKLIIRWVAFEDQARFCVGQDMTITAESSALCKAS